MKESVNIVGKQTLECSNVSSESFVDNAPVLAGGAHAGELPSDRVVTLSENCNVVNPPARTWFKRNVECVKSFESRRRHHPRVKSGECARGALRRRGYSTITMCLIGKVGKFLTQRWCTRECITGCIVIGTADQVIVAVKSLITRGRSEGPVGMVVLGEEGGMGDCSMSYELLRDAGSLANHMFGTSLPRTRGASNRKGKVALYRERPCLKPDTRNGSARNFRGGPRNGILKPQRRDVAVMSDFRSPRLVSTRPY